MELILENDIARVITATYCDRKDLFYSGKLSTPTKIDRLVKAALKLATDCQVYKIEDASVFAGFAIVDLNLGSKKAIVMRRVFKDREQEVSKIISQLLLTISISTDDEGL
jgi:hypothetical protein